MPVSGESSPATTSSCGSRNFTVDGLRRVLEDMPEDSYETMTYYERWIASITRNMVEAGAFTTAELNGIHLVKHLGGTVVVK